MDEADPPARLRHDRASLLLGAKRNEVLTLAEIRRYGADSFGDRGIRLLGRTAVECTRDDRAIAVDIAALAEALACQPASRRRDHNVTRPARLAMWARATKSS